MVFCGFCPIMSAKPAIFADFQLAGALHLSWDDARRYSPRRSSCAILAVGDFSLAGRAVAMPAFRKCTIGAAITKRRVISFSGVGVISTSAGSVAETPQ